MIRAARLDLPAETSSDHSVWTSRMPTQVQRLFLGDGFNQLLQTIQMYISSADVPPPRIHCAPNQYPQMLLRLSDSGRLQWSLVDEENTSYRELANHLTMTSFAVVKDEQKDRLISWPRVQNICIPDSPHVSLPNPGIFSAVLLSDTTPGLSSFFLDISNMFHNILLPFNLAALFPLAQIAFGDLPGKLQRYIERSLGFRPRQAQKMRPCQRTLPMGFKWSVFIGHTFVESCYVEAFRIFQDTSRTLGFTSTFPFPILLHKQNGTVKLTSNCSLILHIIDDLNFVLAGWSDQDAIRLQNLVESVLQRNQLPIKRAKSSPPGELEKNQLTLMGWNWCLQRHILRPKLEKLNSALTSVSAIIKSPLEESRVRSSVGKLIWIALGCRPLVSILYRTFQFLEQPSKVNNSIQVAVFRELTLLARLLPLSSIRLNRPYWNHVIAIDASPDAGAVVYTKANALWISNLTALAFEGPSVNASAMLSYFVQNHHWKTAFVHKWRRDEHINVLEAHTAVLALEWAASFDITGLHVLILSDSMVTIGAFRNGRSSSLSLCLPCRRYAGVCIAHDLEPLFVHVPTTLNPADGPSRPRFKAGSYE